MPKVAITSLGCPRNLVDSEVLLGTLKRHGYTVSGADKNPDLLVINTCSFIQSAREESVDAIMEAANLKREGKVGRIVVCGCLPQLYKGKLLDELPEVDAVFGTSDFAKLSSYLKKIERGARHEVVSKKVDYLYDDSSPRALLTPKHYAYIKVSEGCDNFCSYCIISRLRGRLRSRTVESVLKEIKNVSRSGSVKELEIVGQDTTLFGKDNYGRPMLAELLKRASCLKNSVEWIRVLYTHPAHYTDELIDTIAGEDKICKYLDIPIQHASDRMLKNMNRKTKKRDIMDLIEKLRARIPGIVLRTSVIVGFPGETDKDLKELLDLIKEVKFQRLGAFSYSKEDGTPASKMRPQVPEKVKLQRLDEVMRAQQKISEAYNASLAGKTLKVLIDEKVEGERGEFLGRTESDAPEIDGIVYVAGKGLKTGRFYDVKITDSLEYDLVGEAV
jgi:ribosomal protein S12 methylthiotransferase